jgi:hypothetical protein
MEMGRFEVDKNDIRSLTRISRSLWGDPEQSLAISEDTLSSVSLLRLSDDHTIERASKVMIELAERNPPSLLKLNHPFFRLSPLERFLLTAIHIEKWNYQRIARTLGIDQGLIEPWLWSVRLKFCFQETQSSGLEYPRGPGTLGPVCPEYNATSPWTQRLLDDELGKRERLFLQNHLVACEKCRKTLEITRKFLFKTESMIPSNDSPKDFDQACDRLFQVWKDGEVALRPITVSTRDSILNFIAQPKIQFILALMTFLVIYTFTRKA